MFDVHSVHFIVTQKMFKRVGRLREDLQEETNYSHAFK